MNNPFLSPEDIDRYYHLDSLDLIPKSEIDHNLQAMHRRYKRLLEGKSKVMLFYDHDLAPAIKLFNLYLQSTGNFTPPQYL